MLKCIDFDTIASMKSPLGALFGLALFTFVTIGFLCIIARALILKYDGSVAVAKVTKTDYSSYVDHSYETVNSPYSLQYRFQVPGSSRWYEHYEPMIVGKPAASVTKDTWLAAKKTGTIRVVYARIAPSINLPEAAYPLDGIVCPAIAGTFSAGLALACLWSFWQAIRGKKRKPPSPS